jgi:hypothetical protein
MSTTSRRSIVILSLALVIVTWLWHDHPIFPYIERMGAGGGGWVCWLPSARLPN